MKLKLFDTHCHIHEATFELKGDDATRALWLKANKPDPDDLIKQAKDKGVVGMICVGTTVPDSGTAVRFARNRSGCWASIGVHPHEAKDSILADLAVLARSEEAGESKIVAIGECGLDYFYEHSSKQDQIRALRFQMELALEQDLPMIFHVREAFDDFWPIFDEYKGLRGVVHSFTDNQKNLEKLLARSLYVGINGIITFTKNEWQLDMVKAIPLEHLMLETDAPFLTPAPIRGKVNAPENVSLVADFLAKLRKESPDILAKATTQNAFTLFRLK